MRQAIEHDLGKKYTYTYGQIVFSASLLEEGQLRFSQLILHSDIPDMEKAEEQLRRVIRPDYLDDYFEISQASW